MSLHLTYYSISLCLRARVHETPEVRRKVNFHRQRLYQGKEILSYIRLRTVTVRTNEKLSQPYYLGDPRFFMYLLRMENERVIYIQGKSLSLD